jgi:hypothetical protein
MSKRWRTEERGKGKKLVPLVPSAFDVTVGIGSTLILNTAGRHGLSKATVGLARSDVTKKEKERKLTVKELFNAFGHVRSPAKVLIAFV